MTHQHKGLDQAAPLSALNARAPEDPWDNAGKAPDPSTPAAGPTVAEKTDSNAKAAQGTPAATKGKNGQPAAPVVEPSDLRAMLSLRANEAGLLVLRSLATYQDAIQVHARAEQAMVQARRDEKTANQATTRKVGAKGLGGTEAERAAELAAVNPDELAARRLAEDRERDTATALTLARVTWETTRELAQIAESAASRQR